MPQTKQRHAIYVSVKRKHPTWPSDLIKAEVSRIESSHKVHNASKIAIKPPSKSGSHERSIGSQDIQNEKYLLSYSRNKYQFVLYSIDSSGKKALIRSCKKNDKLNLGPCEIELTWGPEEVKNAES
jgi:hypothetical protein